MGLTKYQRALRAGTEDLFAPSFSSEIKPVLERRFIQEQIVQFVTTSDKNLGIVLATSGGKTIIALLIIDRLMQAGYNKFLYLVPTVELSHQAKSDFLYYREFAEDEIVRLGGLPKRERHEIWQKNKAGIYITTSQNIANDIKSGILRSDFFQVIFCDEGHLAVGNYAYCYVAEKCYPHAKIVALTATPGNIVQRNESAKVLHLTGGWWTMPIEEQLKWQLPIERIVMDIPWDEKSQYIWNMLERVCAGYYAELYEGLKRCGIAAGLKEKFSYLKQSEINELKTLINSLAGVDDIEYNRALHIFAKMQKMAIFTRYLFEESVELAISYFKSLRQDKTKAGPAVFKDNLELVKEIAVLFAWDKDKQQAGVINPKYVAVLDFVKQNHGKQILIIQNYVKSIDILQKNYLLPQGIKTKFLIGKGHGRIQKAKEAKTVRRDFRDGRFKVLQATEVGEIGLHFPKLNLVIFTSIPQTPAEQLQGEGRIGRTKMSDKVIYILFSPFDRQRYYANWAKIRKMFDGINKIPNIYAPNSPKVKSLNLARAKVKLLAKDLLSMDGQMVRERFKVKGVNKYLQGKSTKVTINLEDNTGCINAVLYVKAGDYPDGYFDNLAGKVLLVSGRVKIDNLGEGNQIVNILIHPDQKQNIIICDNGSFREEDYEPH